MIELVKISNHPDKTNIERYVEYLGLTHIAKKLRPTDADKQITLSFLVRYFLDGVEIFAGQVFHTTELRAMETTWLDAEGNIVEEGSEDAVITEYDYFIMLMGMPIVINHLIQAKIQQGDAQGRFDFPI